MAGVSPILHLVAPTLGQAADIRSSLWLAFTRVRHDAMVEQPSAEPVLGETQYLVSSADGGPLWLMIEPEGMSYNFPPHERVLLTVKAKRQIQHIELVHSRDGLALWRSGDSEVWATTADGHHEQIAGFADNPAPWIDPGTSASSSAPWSWPPSAEEDDTELGPIANDDTRSRWFRRLFGSGPS